MARHQSDEFKASDYWHPRFWLMWLTIGLLRLAAMFPYRAQLFMGQIVGKIIRYMSSKRNRVVEINLQYRFPEMSQVERDRIRDDCYTSFGISLFEMAMC
jgi:KDO2-lipid IV(A) lauroyltransferase